MKYKYQALFPGTIVLSTLILLFSCKKINDSTTLGSGLIPAVDNISTFETSLDVEVYNDAFSIGAPHPDSLRVRGGDTYFLGNITNDPLFGTSTATVFTQLKPTFFRFSYGFSSPDSLIGLDSVVLVLSYVNTWGDTTTPQSVNVYEINQAADFRFDSSYLVRENNITYGSLLGSGVYTPQLLDDSIQLFKDKVSHQLRIKLDDAFGQRLLAYDSTATPGNNAYFSDSIFNTLFKGFAIVPGGTGNALIGLKLPDSKLSVYYKYKHGILDTAVKDFTFTALSASANYIQRDYSGAQIASYLGATTPQDYAFLQAQPGTMAKLKIPGLDTFANRVIHRAELYVTQAYNDALDDVLVPPTYLYLDANDSVNGVFRGIPFDVQIPDASSLSIFTPNSGFGFAGNPALDAANKTVREWRFNISRYVQNLVKKNAKPYELRLYAPYVTRNAFDISGTDFYRSFYVNPAMAAGRVRVFGGIPATNPGRMRVRVIYSKI